MIHEKCINPKYGDKELKAKIATLTTALKDAAVKRRILIPLSIAVENEKLKEQVKQITAENAKYKSALEKIAKMVCVIPEHCKTHPKARCVSCIAKKVLDEVK
jgi:hypothetical protein